MHGIRYEKGSWMTQTIRKKKQKKTADDGNHAIDSIGSVLCKLIIETFSAQT